MQVDVRDLDLRAARPGLRERHLDNQNTRQMAEVRFVMDTHVIR